MAMNVSLSANAKPYDQLGQVRVARFNYTGPVSYPNTGTTLGDPVKNTGSSTTVMGLGAIVHCPAHVALDVNGANPRLVVYDDVQKTMRWYILSTNAEVANGVDLSGFVVDVMEVTGF